MVTLRWCATRSRERHKRTCSLAMHAGGSYTPYVRAPVHPTAPVRKFIMMSVQNTKSMIESRGSVPDNRQARSSAVALRNPVRFHFLFVRSVLSSFARKTASYG